MWTRRAVATVMQTRMLPAIKSLRLLTNEQLIQLSQQLAEHSTTEETGKELLAPYVKLVTARTGTMTKEELVKMTGITANSDFLRPVLEESIRKLTPSAAKMTYEECVEVAKVIANAGMSVRASTYSQELLWTLSKILTQEDEISLLSKPTHSFTTLLQSFSSLQIGDGDFYQSLVAILLSPGKVASLSTLQLLRLSVYLRRVHKIAGRGGFGLYAELETRLWDDFHNNRNIDIPTLLRIYGDLIPAGLCSNKLQLLLEFTLYKQLSDPNNRITQAQLVQLLLDSSNYVYKYKPLFRLLQRLVEDVIERLNGKEMVKIVWALGKNNKDCGRIMDLLIGKIREKVENEGCNLRNFTFLLNGCLNGGKTDSELMSYFHTKLKKFDMVESDIHYWVKSLSILAACDIPDPELVNSLLVLITEANPGTVKASDIVRLLCLCETQQTLVSPHLLTLQKHLLPQLPTMPYSHLARLAYITSKIPGFSDTFLTLLETQLTNGNLMTLKPTDLACACHSLTDAMRVKFVHSSLPAVKNFVDVLRKRVVEVGSDSEDEEESVVQEEEIMFGAQWEMTATALVQFCWVLIAADINSPTFWSDRLFSSLHKIRLNPNTKFSLNHWKSTAMALQGNDEYFSTVDGAHFSMLLNVVAMLQGMDKAGSLLSPGISKDSISDFPYMSADKDYASEVESFYKAQFKSEPRSSHDKLLNRIDIELPNKVCVLLYSPEQLLAGRLRACHLFKHRVLELQGYTVRPVLQTDWVSLDPPARVNLFR